jgi:hypothetical protein
MVTSIAGIAAMRKAGLADEEWRASEDRKALEFFAQNDHRLIASAEDGAAGLVEKHSREICLLSDHLIKHHGGSIDGPGIEALLAGRPVPTAPPVTRARALDRGRSVFKPVRTIKNDRDLEIGEVWACRAGDARWFEALTFRSDGSKKKLGRFADQADATKAIRAATARKAT